MRLNFITKGQSNARPPTPTSSTVNMYITVDLYKANKWFPGYPNFR